ncbi:MAG: hypothetical protein MHMPM18_002652 [Marteilia pararefringens]
MLTSMSHLKIALKKSTEGSTTCTATVEEEIEYFIKSKFMGPKLNNLVNYCNTIRPASVNNEKIFSIASLICRQRRMNLAPDKIDTMTFVNQNLE